MYWISVVLPRASGSLRRTCVPVTTPVVHVGRAYSHPNQRGIPTTSAAMARTGASLRHKITASTEKREQDDVTDRQPSLEHGSNLTEAETRNGRAATTLLLTPSRSSSGGMMLV